jgi:uncharacterized protein
MLQRKIDNKLLDWCNRKNKPALLVMGARQVGKTTSIRTFAASHYASFIEINFEEQPSLRRIFEGDLDVVTIYEKLSVAGLGKLIPNNTLLFFDEIQSCPKARTAVKFLVEDGRYDVIASGSLLGINYREVSSYPVGFESKIEMHSLDFEEFLWANEITPKIIDGLKIHYQEKTLIDPFIHSRIMDLFRRYLIVGGMPAVVSTFVETHDISEVILRQKMIIQSYRDDISKYAGTKKGLAKAVFDSIPMHLAAKNRKFVLADIEKDAKNRKYEDAIMWLYDAGIASYCFNISDLHLPFELSERRNIYKFFMRDTGLLSCMSLGNVQNAILNGDITINEGSITENAVADLLLKNGHSLHYFDVKGRLEIDFILNIENTVMPVEVKSGADYKRHASLSKVLSNANRNISSAIVLCNDNTHVENNIIYYPLYMAMFF